MWVWVLRSGNVNGDKLIGVRIIWQSLNAGAGRSRPNIGWQVAYRLPDQRFTLVRFRNGMTWTYGGMQQNMVASRTSAYLRTGCGSRTFSCTTGKNATLPKTLSRYITICIRPALTRASTERILRTWWSATTAAACTCLPEFSKALVRSTSRGFLSTTSDARWNSEVGLTTDYK